MATPSRLTQASTIQDSSPIHSHTLSSQASAFKDSEATALRRIRAASADPGNSLGKALTIRLRSNRFSYTNTVARRDPDFFKLVLTRTSTVRLGWQNRSLTTPIFGAVLDARGRIATYDGERLFEDIAPQQRGAAIYSRVPPGTYYIRVTNRGGSALYSVNLQVQRA